MKRNAVRAPTSASPAATVAPAESGARRQILNAAAYLLKHRGYEATTTRAIATAVGIKGGSIYHHFPSKDAIVGEVVNEGVRVVYDAVEKALGALPNRATPRRRLRRPRAFIRCQIRRPHRRRRPKPRPECRMTQSRPKRELRKRPRR